MHDGAGNGEKRLESRELRAKEGPVYCALSEGDVFQGRF